MPKLRNYKHTKRKKGGNIATLLLFAGGIALAGVVFGGIAVLAVMRGLPDPLAISELKVPQSTKIYDRTGTVLLYEIHGEEKRTVVPFDRISQYAKDATIVAEDFNFYSHPGIDLRSIFRAFIVDVTQWRLDQGGSTITQQLVKKTFLTDEKTLTRKIKEALLAFKIEKNYSKQEIFEFYLNQIPYGSNVYGIESAAQTFFGKSAADLSLNEGVVLAALIKAPSYYSPWGNNKDALIARKDYILDRMEQIGFISADELARAKGGALAFQRQKADVLAPHFVIYVKNYLESHYGVDYVENGGLKVITTLDWELQREAERIVAKAAADNEKRYRANNAALVAVDPKTGQLLTMVGSRDYFDTEHEGNYNVATSQNRQPGSSFKPFAYAELFRKGYPPQTALFDVKTQFSTDPDNPYEPGNYDGRFRGPVTAQSALAQSLNVPSVKVLYMAGIDDVVRLSHDLGITTLRDRSRIGLSLVLGGGEVSPIDMAYAYGVFANDGVRNDKAFILKIEDASGNAVEVWRQKQRNVLEPNVARTISSILSSNELRAPVFGSQSALHFEGFDVAAKTGTTQEYKDAWVVGYTPSLAAAVWVGNNNNTPMERGGAGIAAAGPIFHSFVQTYLSKRAGEPERFTPPAPIESSKPMLDGRFVTAQLVRIDKDSGKLATNLTPPSRQEERVFNEVHSLLHYVNRKNPLGPVPQNPSDDAQYKNWEEALRAWLAENPSFAQLGGLPPTEYDDIHTEANAPRVVVLFPAAGSFLANPARIGASVSSTFRIKEVSFYLDGVLFTTLTSAPWEAGLSTSLVPGGSHTLLVRARDIYDNTGEVVVFVSK